MESLRSGDGAATGGVPVNRSRSLLRAAAVASESEIVAALALAGILAAAGYLRLASPDLALVAGDQSVILGMALRFVRGGPLPLAGTKSSAGIMMPPMTECLLAVRSLSRSVIRPEGRRDQSWRLPCSNCRR